ncbi:Zinc finger FYVE domain-containing protein 26 [Habropoda laboriosa]|uniref:Zinc finger FYVE domain-containing protein 26 n=1 Tax=Habropoda laboriosa TaxID=597456 RepID=A0A0L7R1G6_9HYME|nr:Zinc finger FYVE domain-containing protein 26 [Habropoda laboriosa]
MSKETQKLEINKCISSKLWYTSLIIYRENDNEKFFLSECNNDTVDFVKSETQIANVIHFQNEGQHQWIAHILLHQLINSVSLDNEYIKRHQSYIEMIHALQLCKNLTIHLQEELLTKYKSVSEQTNSENFEKIQNEYFIFLKQNIYNNPFVTCWILNKLSCSNTSNNAICNLQDFYFTLIKELLEPKLSKHQLISDNSFGYILCIISKMSINELNADTLSKWLFPILLKTNIIYNVELALYSRVDEKLFKKWCTFHNEVYLHSKMVNNLCNAEKIQDMLFHFTFTSVPTINTNKLIERITNNKLHWVIDILDICYTLLINEKYNEVTLILSHPLLKAILPALLFKVLNDCSQEEFILIDVQKDYDYIHNSIEFLISKCNFDVWCDSASTELKHILRKNIKIFKYILNCIRENLKTEDSNQVPEITKSVNFQQRISIKSIFDLLQHFNSLSVLKMTTNIHEQKHNNIKHLLKDLCEPENIFHAYCTMLSALKAILLCDNYDTQESTIKSYFSDMYCYIQMIHPLNLRIQVVENIFALLFLRHKDFDYIQKSYDKNDTNTSHEQLKFKHKWVKQYVTDFICNKYAVRDILFYLRDIMLAVESEYLKMKSKDESIEEVDQIQKDIASINAAIIDAECRLELYTTSEFAENINIKDENQIFVPKSKTKVLLGEKLIYNSSEEEVHFYQESSISDDTKIKSNSSSESESMYNSNKWRKRFKNTTLIKDGLITKDMTHKPLFINFMLATKESLIIRYLWKNDYVKAQDIIEVFDMKNSQLNGEVQFSKALHIFKKNIYKQTNMVKDNNQSSKNLHSSTLENIRLVTQEGIESSRQTSQLETFLASQEINLQILSKDTFNNYEILTICVLDFALTMISDLLKIPLHYYFGYQIFELKIEPNELEAIAHNLQINLACSILTNICPKFFYEKNISYTITSKEDGCIILNKTSRKSDSSYTIQGPNQCVSEILTEILQVLHNLNLSQSVLSRDVCKSISKYSEIQNVLNKTSRLVSLDLSELSMGDETLTFLLNTWNLMFLHATLTIWAYHFPLNNLQHTVSLMSIGYLIGDLGLVTLAALRSKLLNNMTLDDNFFIQFEELNEPAWQDLDITHDPRVIFIMANEFFGTPNIQVSCSFTNAFHEYLNHYAVKSNKYMQNADTQNTILLPEIAERYETFISQNLKNDLQNSNNCNNLFSINDYFKPSNENIVIEYMPPSYSCSIILKYTNCSNIHNQKQINQYKTTWKTHSIRSSVLQYLESQCWVVSYLWQRIHNKNPTILENNCDNLKRTACLENLLSSSWVMELKLLFDNNQTLAAILETISIEKLWSHLELMIKENKWNACLKLVNALPSHFTLNTEMQCFKDKVLSHIVLQKDTTLNAEILQYLYQIKDVYILSQTVLFNINRWDINICENALLHVVHHIDNYKLSVHCKLQLNEILHRVLIFHKMLPYCITKSNGTWYDIAYCTEKVDALEIIKSLINEDKFELCLEWMECQGFSLEIHPSVTQEFLIGFLKSESQNFKQTLKFFQALPLDQSIKLCKTMLTKLESIDSLRFICNYLLQYCEATEIIKYRRTLLGIDILCMLDVQERQLYIHFIKKPLLMLEQLLMNCKFESIQRILYKIQDKLDKADISRNSFDKIIRFYAQKSLDCRVSLECYTTESKSKNVEQPTLDTESTEFIMPTLVPTKEEWVPNDKARKCSCCKTVIFSMFNRRHHCRRCGRVICATCSQHQSPSPSSSEIFDYWRLTTDEKHNETIREEFSFEYAPNISLCLAILNLHSEHKTYASFLLDCCDDMKRLLQPVSGGKVNPEIDHTVIIKMIRSLLVAAKVKCAKLGLNTGLIHCDSFLSQVDLIASLVQSDCLQFILCDYLDDYTFRKLRDLLIEKEQWTLALDMSTKVGLDTQGVWVAWGKTWLKMRYFEEARDKFSHCLDKIQDELKKTEFSKNRPLKDPPLLTEILQILDNLNVYKQYVQYSHQYKCNASQEILSNFGSFKIINQKPLYKNTSATMQNVYYQESLYYLLAYGSYNSILEFFLTHEEFDKCLTFTLENDLEPDLFFNTIYLYCLKNGCIEKLHEAMMNKDSSLLIWKKYLIYVCHSLEKRQYLNILYQLQLFMKDYIRAAMTCIRFYLNEVNNYTELCTRVHFLLDAQKHLESELQIETLNRKRRKSMSSMHGNQGILTMEMELSEIDKHINTICRQMEITKFLANCEKDGRAPIQFLNLFPEKDSNNSYILKIPTLFGNQEEKIDLAVLTMLCGHNIEEGFGIAFRIMQDYNLPQQKVYSLAGHILIMKNNIAAIEQLIKCCHTSGIKNSYIISDYVLAHCVKLFLSQLHNETESVLKNDIYNLVRLITDIELKINTYIECKQLKAAYLLAVRHSRAQDIRKILKESDRLGQNAIKAICIKWLQQESKL